MTEYFEFSLTVHPLSVQSDQAVLGTLALGHDGIDGGYGGDGEDVAHAAFEVGKVDGLVQTYLQGADNLHIGRHVQDEFAGSGRRVVKMQFAKSFSNGVFVHRYSNTQKTIQRTFIFLMRPVERNLHAGYEAEGEGSEEELKALQEAYETFMYKVFGIVPSAITETYSDTMHNNVIYDLNGRRISKPVQSGIYIVKGNIIVVQ